MTEQTDLVKDIIDAVLDEVNDSGYQFDEVEATKNVEKLLATARAEGAATERERIKDLLRDKGCGFCNYDTDSMIDEALTTKEHHAS